MGSLSSLRAADADRERTAERLRHATAEGRLTPDELEQRLDVLYRSRTYGELEALVADLPVTRSPAPAGSQVPRRLVPAGAATAVLLMLAALVSAARHSAMVAGDVPRRFRETGSGRPLAAQHHFMTGPASALMVISLLVVCVAMFWVLKRSRGARNA